MWRADGGLVVLGREGMDLCRIRHVDPPNVKVRTGFLLVYAKLFQVLRAFLQHDRSFALNLPANQFDDIRVGQSRDVTRVHGI